MSEHAPEDHPLLPEDPESELRYDDRTTDGESDDPSSESPDHDEPTTPT